jgi:hypothetical protein
MLVKYFGCNVTFDFDMPGPARRLYGNDTNIFDNVGSIYAVVYLYNPRQSLSA